MTHKHVHTLARHGSRLRALWSCNVCGHDISTESSEPGEAAPEPTFCPRCEPGRAGKMGWKVERARVARIAAKRGGE